MNKIAFLEGYLLDKEAAIKKRLLKKLVKKTENVSKAVKKGAPVKTKELEAAKKAGNKAISRVGSPKNKKLLQVTGDKKAYKKIKKDVKKTTKELNNRSEDALNTMDMRGIKRPMVGKKTKTSYLESLVPSHKKMSKSDKAYPAGPKKRDVSVPQKQLPPSKRKSTVPSKPPYNHPSARPQKKSLKDVLWGTTGRKVATTAAGATLLAGAVGAPVIAGSVHHNKKKKKAAAAK